jgi:hypothetical protein
MKRAKDIVKHISLVLAKENLSWASVAASADEIILFGSHASGCASERSDVDLICVGEGRRVSSHRLHLLWLPASVVHDPDWLSTEIGGHVACYGYWLKGLRTIGSAKPASSVAISRKISRIAERAEVLVAKWSRLSPRFRIEQSLKLRRDVQRLAILKNGASIPPTPILDRYWIDQKGKYLWLRNILSAADDRLTKTVLPLLTRSQRNLHRPNPNSTDQSLPKSSCSTPRRTSSILTGAAKKL